MDFIELCKQRESCRSYTDEQVSDEALRTIVEAGRLAPSACNSQPWKFYVVNGDEHAATVRRGVQIMGNNKFTEKAPAFIVVTGEKPNYPERVGQVIFGRDFSSIDIGIAVANMTLCATSLGLGTCILGMFTEKTIKEGIGLSKKDKTFVQLVISVGHPAKKEPRNKNRKAFDDVAVFVGKDQQ